MMKWKKSSFAIALLASASLVFGMGCSDDDVTGTDNSDTQEDVGTDSDEELDTTDEDTGDDVDDGNDADDVDEEPDVDLFECAFPNDDPDCPEGDFGPASFFKDFVIETRSDEDACCFDIDPDDDDPFIDNMIGEQLISVAANLPGMEDPNANIAAAIQSGDLIYLLEMAHWDNAEFDSDVDLRVYKGGRTDESMEDNLAGDGSFFIAPDNFDQNDDNIYGFTEASIEDGQLTASDGFISIEMPGLIDGVVADLGAVQIRGDIVQDPEPELGAGGNFTIENGELGGGLYRDRFFQSINRLSYDCDCLDIDIEDPDSPDLWTEGLFSYRESSDNWSCEIKTTSGEDLCQEPGDPSQCRTLGFDQMCNMLSFVSGETDLVIDGEKAFSVGIRFEAVTTEIRGIDENE